MQYLSPYPGSSKRKILLSREEELRHALKGDAPSKIRRAAERVRTAQLHLIKAFRHSLVSYFPEDETSQRAARLQNLQEAKDFWEGRPVDDIVDEYARVGELDQGKPDGGPTP